MRIVVFPLVLIFSCNSFPFRLRLEFAAFIGPGYVPFKGINQESMFSFFNVVMDILEVVLPTDVY